MDFTLLDSSDSDFHFGDLYVLKQSLGKGSFGRVVHCLNKSTNIECAVKIINKTDLSIDLAAAASEVQILSSLDHPNVVKFQGIHHNKHHIFLEMELLRGGTLGELLKTRELSDEEAAMVMKGIFLAVSYLHSRDILHRDLKPDNIMLLSEELHTVKLADFGLSAKFGQHTFAKTFEDMCGTVSFMAPEQIMHRNYSKPVDLWSSAITLYMAIARRHPLLDQSDTVLSYTQKLQNPNWTFPDHFNPLAKQLFLHLTNLQPLERYTAEQALAHPWITREETEVPRTYLERISEYNSKTQLWRLFGLLVAVGSVVYLRNGKARKYVKEQTPAIVVSMDGEKITKAKTMASPGASPSPQYRGLQVPKPPDVGRRDVMRRRSTDCTPFQFIQRPSVKSFKKTPSPQPQKSPSTLRPAVSGYLRKPQPSPHADRKTH